MDLSKRSLVLNHDDCQLTVHVNNLGSWSINRFIAVSSPITFGSIIGVFLVGVFMVGMLFLFLGREFFTSEQNNQRITQPSRQSKRHMTNLEGNVCATKKFCKKVNCKARSKIAELKEKVNKTGVIER